MQLIEVTAVGWLACLWVDFYTALCFRAQVKARKPFSCQKCMGFWMGLGFILGKQFLTHDYSAMEVFIFSLLTSLAATIEYALIRRI